MLAHAHRSSSDSAVVLGVDLGTLSGRALVGRVPDGAELGTAVHEYAHAVIERSLPATGVPLPPDWALQDPEDYREVLRHAVPAALADGGVDPARVIGIGIDFTACTVNAAGTCYYSPTDPLSGAQTPAYHFLYSLSDQSNCGPSGCRTPPPAADGALPAASPRIWRPSLAAT
jgi:hypothetical protein